MILILCWRKYNNKRIIIIRITILFFFQKNKIYLFNMNDNLIKNHILFISIIVLFLILSNMKKTMRLFISEKAGNTFKSSSKSKNFNKSKDDILISWEKNLKKAKIKNFNLKKGKIAEQEINEDSVVDSTICMRYKIIFVGDANTGKTSIINRIIDNPFNETYEPSEGIDFISKNIRFNGLNIRIQIWDSAGQEKYRGLIPSYVRNCPWFL